MASAQAPPRIGRRFRSIRRISILHRGRRPSSSPGEWHDWWNEADRDARVRVEVTPGKRFLSMIETLFGLARLGYTDGKGMPSPLQLALTSQEFSAVIVFRSPPLLVQRALFGAMALIARCPGYRGTYPELSRIVLAPRRQRPGVGSGGAGRALTQVESTTRRLRLAQPQA